VDILITKNGFQTLMDIIVVDSTCINMMQQVSTMTTHVMMMVVQEKTRSYVEQTQGNDFIPFSIETYGCLHSRFDSFLTTCVNTTNPHHHRFSSVNHQCLFLTINRACP
jgi:hypothetical protein